MKTLSQKIMALAIMLLSVTLSAYADTWTDPETGITWTYTVLNDGTVALGSGYLSTPAVPTSTTGELTVPAQINGKDVTSVKACAFSNCSKITNIIFEPESITLQEYAHSMFNNCRALKSLQFLKNWNTSNVTGMEAMFYNCENLSDISGLSNWDMSKVTSISQMFQQCSNLSDLSPLANWNVGKVTNMFQTFYNCKKITTLHGLENWNTGNVTNMEKMFMDCRSLTSLEQIGNWNTSNVTNMKEMFAKTTNLQYATAINNWNIQNCTNLRQMFAFSGLVFIDMSSWDVTGKDLRCMFAQGLNTNLYDFDGRAYYSDLAGTAKRYLERVYLPKKGLTKIPAGMFYNCYVLKEITIPSTVNTIERYAFASCNSLKEITIPSKVTSIGDRAFWECYSLTEVYCMPITPPTVMDDKYFFGDRYGNINKTLYVKTSSLDKYQNQSGWKRFTTITDMIPIVIGSTKNYSTLSFDFDADFSETTGVQPYIANKYLEGEEALDYISGFSEAKKRMSPALKKAADSGNTDIKLIVLARYPDGYVPSRTGEDNFDFHGIILYGKPGTYYFKMGEQDFASDNPKTVTWNTNYMKSAYESWLLNPTYDHKPVNWMEYPKEDTYNFVLKNNLFKYIDNAGTINRHKSWLELPAQKVSGSYFEAGAKMISTFDPDDSDSFATGLSFIVEDEPAETQNRYNLNGQKVDTNYKGVVIVNGKKLYNK